MCCFLDGLHSEDKTPFFFGQREYKLLEHAKAIKVTAGTEPDAELGPVVSKQVQNYFSSFTLLLLFSEKYWFSLDDFLLLIICSSSASSAGTLT